MVNSASLDSLAWASSSIIAGDSHQPLRAEIRRAAQLAYDSEDHARARQHPKGKYTARERLDLLFDSNTFMEGCRFAGGQF